MTWAVLILNGCSTFSPSVADQLTELNSQYDISPEYARQQLADLKKDNSKDARPWVSSGNWSLKEEDIERAKIAFKQALRLEAKNSEALMGLAICADKNKDHLKAQEFYRQALELKPYNPKIISNYALSYILSNKPLPAIILLEPLVDSADIHKGTSKNNEPLTKKENARISANLSLAYSLNGDLDKAYAIDKDLLGETQAQQNRLAAESLQSASK